MKGRKRHIVTDTMGNLLAIKVHAANTHDTKSGIDPAKKAIKKYPTIKGFCADAGYRKTFVLLVFAILGLFVDIAERISSGFEMPTTLRATTMNENLLVWLYSHYTA